jgi:hypothetical protein
MENTKKIKTYAAIILDKSGSMGSIREQAINNFNEQIQTLKNESNDPKAITKKLLHGSNNPVGVETLITLVSFADDVTFHTFNEEVNKVEEFPANEYKPNGSTAMRDAIGDTIDRITKEATDLSEPDVGVLMIIVTDGFENASKRYGGEEGRKILKSRIEELEKTGKWTFTFMGCENAFEESRSLGMSAGNTQAWVASAAGATVSTATQNIGTRHYMSERLMHKTSVQNFYAGVDQDELKEEESNLLKKYAKKITPTDTENKDKDNV